MISYKAGYRYQLVETYRVGIPIYPAEPIKTKYLSLSTGGLLTIRNGYAWDGPSGPTIDTKNFMRASLVHDSLFQLIRCDLLAHECFGTVNLELKRMCRQDGMSRLRAWYVWKSVQWFGKAATMTPKAVLTAP